MSKKKFKIVPCKNLKCPRPGGKFMVEKGKFESFCSPECRHQFKEDTGSDYIRKPYYKG